MEKEEMVNITHCFLNPEIAEETIFFLFVSIYQIECILFCNLHVCHNLHCVVVKLKNGLDNKLE